jgi:hypothetical protein
MEHSQAPTCHKMKLPDPRSLEMDVADSRLSANDKVPVVADPMVRQMAKLDEVIAATLSSGREKRVVKRKLKLVEHTVKKKKQRNTDPTASAICDTNLQRLHLLKTHFNQLWNPLARVLTQYQRELTASQVPTSDDVAEGDVKREKQQPRLNERSVVRKVMSTLPVEEPTVLSLFYNF